MGRSGNLTYTLKNPEISSLKKLAARAFAECLRKEYPEAGSSYCIVTWWGYDNPDKVSDSWEEMEDKVVEQLDQIMTEEEDDFEPEKSIDFSESYELQTRNYTFSSHIGWSPSDFVGESRRISPCDTISYGERRLADSMSDKVSYEDYDFDINEFFKEFWHWNPYWIESCTIVSTWIKEM
tara:strand:- start:56 stop:595 length:540 start_codon:yes stop_codon:yes gene_type:complete